MHIRGLLAPHSMRNNVGPARHSIRIQCGTEWMVPFAEPIQCRIKCRIHCIHHFCPCSFPFFTSEWLIFTNSCNIIMFLYFFYASNETKTKQIGQVLMEIYISLSKPDQFASTRSHSMRKVKMKTSLYYALP